MKISFHFAAALLLLPLAVSADETFRCGKWLTSSDMSVHELLEKCGEPTSMTRETIDVKTRNANNGLIVKVGETTVETWTYNRAPSRDMVVTVVDGKIKSIERGK